MCGAVPDRMIHARECNLHGVQLTTFGSRRCLRQTIGRLSRAARWSSLRSLVSEVSSSRELKAKSLRAHRQSDEYAGWLEWGRVDEHVRVVNDALRPVQKELGLARREAKQNA